MGVLCFYGCKYDSHLLEFDPAPPAGYSSSNLPAGSASASSYSYYYGGTAPALPTDASAVANPGVSTSVAPSSVVASQSPAASTAAAPAVTQAPQTAAPATQAANYASYTPAQVVSLLSDAVNKTKAYTGTLVVHHKESFENANITNVNPGGALVQQAIDFVKNLVIKPTEEDYQFSGGLATTSEGEQTQLLLPKAAPFSLTADGVQSATAAAENGMVHVKITLKPEQCTSLTQVPTYNASSIGYLDIASKFSVLKIEQVNIQYPGSTIDAYIRPDGYVQNVTYVIKLSAHAQASAMGISGSADFSGNQTEIWTLKW